MRNDVTFKDALVDTLRYYSEDINRRAHYGNSCFFIHEDGRRCAVGRFSRQEQESFFKEMNGMTIEAVVHEHQARAQKNGRLITEEQAIRELVTIKDADMRDLLFLEIIHDEDPNWNEYGLSEFGMETVQHFCPDIVEDVHAALEHGVTA